MRLLLICSLCLQLYDVSPLFAQVDTARVVSIEVYSMSLSTTTRFDYSPAFLVSSIDSVREQGSNASNRFRVQLSAEEVNRIWPKLSNLIEVPDSSARMLLDCRVVLQLTTMNGHLRQVSLNGAKQSVVDGYRLNTGNRVYRLMRKVVPDIGQ